VARPAAAATSTSFWARSCAAVAPGTRLLILASSKPAFARRKRHPRTSRRPAQLGFALAPSAPAGGRGHVVFI